MRDNYYICNIKKLINKVLLIFKRNTMCYCHGYSGLAIADYLINKAIHDGKNITNMSVLKMIFFAQGFGFSELNRQLINDDFYAWKWGPVEAKTYEEFRKYKEKPITKISGKTTDELDDINKHIEITNFLDKIYRLVDIDPFKLSEKTHESGSPWAETPAYEKIDTNIIRDFYTKAQ